MNKKLLSIIAGFLIIIGVVGSLLTYRYYAPEPISEEKIIDSRQISMIDINTNNADVNIYLTKEDSIKVTLEGEASLKHDKIFSVDTNDSLLSITYDEKQRRWFSFNIFQIFSPLTLNVYLPEKEYESFNVSNSNGDIAIEKQLLNEIELNTNNGEIELVEIDALNIIAEVNNGQINLKESIAQNIYVNIDNGNVHFDHVEGDVDGEIQNGDALMTTKNLDRDITFNINNGDITIKTEKEPSNNQFNVTVANGNIDILDEFYGSTTVGDGENLIELTTMNGDISVVK